MQPRLPLNQTAAAQVAVAVLLVRTGEGIQIVVAIQQRVDQLMQHQSLQLG